MFISLGGLLRFFQKSTAGFSFLLSVFFFFVRPVSHRLLTLGLTPRPIAGLDLLIFLLAACCSLRAASPAAFFLLGRIASPLTAASFQPCIWSKTGISFCQRIIFLFFFIFGKEGKGKPWTTSTASCINHSDHVSALPIPWTSTFN
jgi:hypothetical protein